ncbi:unnamed protein product [Porites lobata]|uniref:Uncharacterized protein n=1 Tax=Porites lobata TaxID=104759 RepID=A0ABN8PSE8_9CNID|nr:unnamed protein product [Porites lobata]
MAASRRPALVHWKNLQTVVTASKALVDWHLVAILRGASLPAVKLDTIQFCRLPQEFHGDFQDFSFDAVDRKSEIASDGVHVGCKVFGQGVYWAETCAVL